MNPYMYPPIPPIIYQLEMIENGEIIKTIDYPMVPSVNDKYELNDEESFLVCERKLMKGGHIFRFPTFNVKLYGKVIKN